MEVGLRDGSKVAVIGGGITGAAMAAALLYSARCRGRALEVKVFEGGVGDSIAPVLLTAGCRSRLSALGCRVAPEWRAAELRGLEVLRGGNSELLPFAQSVWVVDDWPRGEPGRELVSRSLSAVGALHGAQFITRRVDQVQYAPFRVARKPGADEGAGPGELVVRSQGVGERFHAAALATGAGDVLGDAFFEGFRPAPSMPAVEARVRLPAQRGPTPSIARLWLWPLADVEGLYLIPCGQSVHAFAWGERVEPADLCQALMMAGRDGHLPDGFELACLRMARAPRGTGKRVTGPGCLAVGPAAVGHPLQLGIADVLASCSRGAIALVDAAHDSAGLRRHYLLDGIDNLQEDADSAASALRWLRRAGRRSLRAIRAARLTSIATVGHDGGVLGLGGPRPRALMRRARRAALAQLLEDSIWPALEPFAPDAALERDLVYVVDDDPHLREALTLFLEQRGVEVVAFADELALYCAVARRPPTAILLDVVLNWVDGLRLCEGLKQHPLTRGARVLVMSGLDREHVRARARQAGAEAFLPKPIDVDELWAALAQGGQPDRDPRPTRDAAEEHGLAS